MPLTWEDDIEKPPVAIITLKIIGWCDFTASCLLLIIALITKDRVHPFITVTTGLIYFLQGIIICTLFNAIAVIVNYLYEIKEAVKSKSENKKS